MTPAEGLFPTQRDHDHRLRTAALQDSLKDEKRPKTCNSLPAVELVTYLFLDLAGSILGMSSRSSEATNGAGCWHGVHETHDTRKGGANSSTYSCQVA